MLFISKPGHYQCMEYLLSEEEIFHSWMISLDKIFVAIISSEIG